MRSRNLFFLIPIVLLFCTGEDGCSEQAKAHQEAIDRASNRAAYIPHNDVEFNNYNERNKKADDPTTIMWCTSSFPIPSSPLFTVPVVGKVTSGSKRTFESDPGPDGMYGASGQYDYGLTPGHMLAEWHGMPQFCTDEPLTWQREKTIVAMEIDPELIAAHNAAREALKKGDKDKAVAILTQAIDKVKQK